MVEDTTLSQNTVEISGNVAHKIISYDKDVEEIKLANTIDSDKYDVNFIKDVCIDEGTLFHPKVLEEKTIDRMPSPEVSGQITEENSDLMYWKKDDARKSVNELKPEAIVPVELAPICTNEKQYSTGKEYNDHDGRITTAYTPGDPSDKKISLQELLLLESAEESRLASTVNCESSEKQHPPHEDAVGQAPTIGSHDFEAILPKTSDHVSSGVSSTMSEDQRTALDTKKSNQIDRHNPFIDHRSLVIEGISDPACSIPSITDGASTEPICSVSKTDKTSNVVSDSTELIGVNTVVSGLDAASSSNPDNKLSEKGNDDSENLASKAITEAVDKGAVSTSSPHNNSKNKNKCDVDGLSDVHDINQIDEENDIDTEDAVGKTLVQFESAVVQTAPERSKSTARTGNGDPYVSNFFGPSIMSAPVSNSGHIAYPGNTSIRSDSSTTSTRSFAFPVLQRDWISSPDRMPRAERRHARMRFDWRKGLICCKF